MNDAKKRIETRQIHYLNYWIVGLFFILRVLDYIFSFIGISLGLGFEANPIGFNLFLIFIGFLPIMIFLVVNYLYPGLRVVLIFIFFITLLLAIIQVTATFNVIFIVLT